MQGGGLWFWLFGLFIYFFLLKYLEGGFLFKIHPEEVCEDWMVHGGKADVNPRVQNARPCSASCRREIEGAAVALRIKFVTKVSKRSVGLGIAGKNVPPEKLWELLPALPVLAAGFPSWCQQQKLWREL